MGRLPLSILTTLFGWPNGIVVGNLLASAIWAIPAFVHLHLRLRKIHRNVKGQLR